MVIPAFLTHLSIGSPWAWSVIVGSLIREKGFVVSASLDWTLAQATFPLSLIFFFQGLSAALAGSWQMKAGTRASMALAGLLFGGGMIVGSAGIATHQLWLLYLGYGFMAGCGVGIAYTPPIQALIEWFPERKGLASGLTIGGFGSGAIILNPLFTYLSHKFQKLPEFVGSLDSVRTITKNGRLFVENSSDGLREVVMANASDLAKSQNNLVEGFYYVGTGSTGAASALAICGAMYTGLMLLSAFTMKRPLPGYKPAGVELNANIVQASNDNVHVNQVMKTPQYWFLATTFYCLATGGIGVFSVARPMMMEVFGSAMPSVVTASFASGFVLLLAAGNLVGRIAWAALSDKIGRRKTFFIFTLGSIPLYLSLPTLVSAVVTHSSLACLYGFIGCSVISISIMGGCYSLMPAYEADLFGAKYVGPIHGRFLLASSAAALAGPSLILALRKRSEMNAIRELLEKVSPEKFQEIFGVDMSHVAELIDAKTLTISKLMKMVPQGVQDPSPFIYDSTMYAMAGLMTMAAASHILVKKVDTKYLEKIEEPKK